MLVHGVRFPYTFTRILRLPAPGTMTITYLVRNESALPLPYLYSAHPLLQCSPGSRVVLPAQVTQLRVDNSAKHRFGGVGDAVDWPLAEDREGRRADLSVLDGPEMGTGDKLYTSRLAGDGQAGLIDPVRGVWTGFRWSTAELPRLGVWLNQGGFRGDFNLALEPCSGYPDRLDLALARGEAAVLEPGGEAEWTIRFGAGAGGEDDLREWLAS
jgi:galactose mutarotase-like enzyme